jgi:serine/threonine-protein kinase
LNHTGIVTVWDLGWLDEQTPYIIMDYVEGRPFGAVLAEAARVDWRVAFEVVARVCEPLQAAHAAGCTHRDLKPDNIIITTGGDVKILDFGIAHVADAVRLTQTGFPVGTPLYMSREQVACAKDIDGRADIYSLGVILFHALTGQHPFDDESYPMLVVKICTEPPPPLRNYRPDLPPEFEAVVGRMLAKNAEERFPNTQAVREALVPFRTFFGAPVLAEGVLPTAKIAPTQALSGVRHSSPTSAGNPSARTPVPATTPVNVPMTNVAPASRFGTPVPSSDYAATTGFTPEKSKAPLFIGIGVALFLLVGIVAAVIVVLGSGTGTTTTTSNPPETPPETRPETPTMETAIVDPPTMETETPIMETVEAAEQVRLIINLEPADAELFIDGASMGSNFNARVPANTALHLEARREGYETLTQDFTPRFDGQVLTLTLERGRGTPRENGNTTTMMSVTSMEVAETPMEVYVPMETPMETPMVMEGFMDIML